MTHALDQMNWIAIALASAAHFVLGGIWFAMLFPRPYARALGLDPEVRTKPGALLLIGPFVCSLFTIATTAFLLASLRITTYGDAWLLGVVVGVGYLATTTMTIAINPLFPHPFRYALVNAPMFLIGSVLACSVLVVMG